MQEGGARDLSTQTWCCFFGSVSVSFFVESRGGLVGVVALCGGVVRLMGGVSKTVRTKD